MWRVAKTVGSDKFIRLNLLARKKNGAPNGAVEKLRKSLEVLAVIVAYGGSKDVKICVESLRESARIAGEAICVVVVDNFPSPVFKSDLEAISDIYLPRHDNPGFGTSCNWGIRAGLIRKPETRFVFLLNPDTSVDSAFFSRLKQVISSGGSSRPVCPAIVYSTSVVSFRAAELFAADTTNCFVRDPEYLLSLHSADGTPQVRGKEFEIHPEQFLSIDEDKLGKGLASFAVRRSRDGRRGPKAEIVDVARLARRKDHIIQNLGSYVGPSWAAGDQFEGYLWSRTEHREGAFADAWCGAATILPVSYLREAGQFDERFFLYFEDTELAVRGNGRGLHARVFPSLIVRHEHSATTSGYPKRRAKAIIESQTLFSSLCYGLLPTFLLVSGRFFRGFFQFKSRRQAILNLGWSLLGFLRLFKIPGRPWKK